MPASHQAALLIRHLLFRLPIKMNVDEIPRVTFTDPELAHVGLTDEQARERHGAIRVLRWPYHDNDRAQAERETRGHIKVVTNAKGLILGATIVGAAAGEQITAWTLAISQGSTSVLSPKLSCLIRPIRRSANGRPSPSSRHV